MNANSNSTTTVVSGAPTPKSESPEPTANAAGSPVLENNIIHDPEAGPPTPTHSETNQENNIDFKKGKHYL